MTPNCHESVHVDLGERSYVISIGTGTLPHLGSELVALRPVTHAVVITDSHVQPYAVSVAESLAEAGADIDVLTVTPGERSKNAEVAESLWNELLAAAADRNSVVVAVGGGVIGDLAGFVAATFARGLDFIQVPTTLLAQVDSSVGGKTGINLPGAKNMVGAFWQPRGVWIDTQVLRTLSDREFAAGLAEVVKYGVILDSDFFDFLEREQISILAREDAPLRFLIARCCRLKADVVEHDERETSGLRAVLNYGHTFGHAFEAATAYGSLLHGEAVAIGMTCAARLAVSLGRIDPSLLERQTRLLRQFHLPTDFPHADPDELLPLMMHDKKVEHGALRFVLPTRLGHVELVGGVSPELVRAALVP